MGGVEFDNMFEGLFNSSFSAVVEEVIFRLFPVLLPVAVYLIMHSEGTTRIGILGLRDIMLALFKPTIFKKRLGIRWNSDLRRLEASLVFVSSIIFALAHPASGLWGPGKFLTALIAGLVLGFSALRFGFESSILIHWFYNAYWPSLAIASLYSLILASFYQMVFHLTLLLGGIFLVSGIHLLLHTKKWEVFTAWFRS
ncbi:MAG: CPBP family intramembrane metalloprotease [Candidatus Verstraetearchaeota archaeon]|nr:CPBP family intramembrane metalloprotease [Candidatus Verstraetearchaeota archaeon]